LQSEIKQVYSKQDTQDCGAVTAAREKKTACRYTV